ncbi:MAG: nuclear transport factor 2 family protein [Ferruginibacter sp.]
MKRIIAISMLLFFFFNASAQNRQVDLIKAAMDEQLTAWNAGDIDRYMQTYWHNDSLMFIGKSGVTYGWENTLKNYKKGYPDAAAMGKLDFQLLNIKRMSGKYYSVVGKWHLARSIGDIGGAFTLLFKKVNGKWLIIQDHSS